MKLEPFGSHLSTSLHSEHVRRRITASWCLHGPVFSVRVYGFRFSSPLLLFFGKQKHHVRVFTTGKRQRKFDFSFSVCNWAACKDWNSKTALSVISLFLWLVFPFLVDDLTPLCVFSAAGPPFVRLMATNRSDDLIPTSYRTWLRVYI